MEKRTEGKKKAKDTAVQPLSMAVCWTALVTESTPPPVIKTLLIERAGRDMFLK